MGRADVHTHGRPGFRVIGLHFPAESERRSDAEQLSRSIEKVRFLWRDSLDDPVAIGMARGTIVTRAEP